MARDKAYRKAEEKIEMERRLGTKKLDLSAKWNAPDNERLTELPESLAQLTQLQELDFSNNQLTALPDWLGQLTQLQSLNLSDNQLTALPDSIGQLTQLQELNFSDNQLTALPESLRQLTQLQELNLSDNQLPTVPEWLGNLTQLQSLNLSDNQLTALPDWLGELTQLQKLDLSGNQLTALPESIGQLTQLRWLEINSNQLTALPETLSHLAQLKYIVLNNNDLRNLPECLGLLSRLQHLAIGPNNLTTLPESLARLSLITNLYIQGNALMKIPDWVFKLTKLQVLNIGAIKLTELPAKISELHELSKLYIDENQLTDLPPSLAQLEHLTTLDLDDNPLNPELAAAYKEGLDSVKAYLRAKATAQITLNEAKLILIGEGEVGKTCLMDALLGNPWQEHDTTHGIEIKQIKVTDPESNTEITLNGWDFGGQRVYRPTHQLFFSAPAVYLLVWKPREGPQQGFVKEWIKLVKHREPDAKILVVATHGGPQQRQPDIDRQELWDLFGKDTLTDFFHVESKPDKKGKRCGIEELKQAIARVASSLPEMGRSVPKRWQDVRTTMEETGKAYLPLAEVLTLCRKHKMEDEEADLFVTISHRLGHLIHYQHDPTLRDIVVLKPDWLATAISYVLDDKATRKAHGLVRFSRLSQLWDDPTRAAEFRYPAALHRIFLRLMERFDLSYRVAGPPSKDHSDPSSLIAQLVPDTRPEKDLEGEWPLHVTAGDIQQAQICRIVDQKGQSATAEGLFYQLTVRLHKYSLGRVNFKESVHWQRGLVLDDDYNGRALVEHVGNDVHITVRAPYPERFLAMLTAEVKYLVESFWEGLRCDVMVPCVEPCGKNEPGTALYEVEKLIESKRRGRPDYPCPVCNEWQGIDDLLRNAPASRPLPAEELIDSLEVLAELRSLRGLLVAQHVEAKGRFAKLDVGQRELLSKADAAYTGLMQALTDEAKEGPRLFSLLPADRKKFNPKEWTSQKFRLTLWCEHSRLPLSALNGKDSKKGVYEIELTREWFKKAAPVLKVITGTLSLVLPVASSGIKFALDDKAYKAIEERLDFGKDIIDASLSGSEKISDWLGGKDATSPEHGEAIRAQGATLRELHALLKAKDPGFGGLVRVMNNRQEFLWVHPQFENEY
jgi:Leucine-rich repeat (LRR) protein